jgi:hypothetical protein
VYLCTTQKESLKNKEETVTNVTLQSSELITLEKYYNFKMLQIVVLGQNGPKLGPTPEQK